MSFTDGKPWIATESNVKARWGGGLNGKYFICGLCGYKFHVGDTVRWQYTNDTTTKGYGNPLVCVDCDGTKEEIIAKRIELREQFEKLCMIFQNPLL